MKRKSPFSKAVEILEQSRMDMLKRGYKSSTVIHTEGFVRISNEMNSSEGEELEYWKSVMDKYNNLRDINDD